MELWEGGRDCPRKIGWLVQEGEAGSVDTHLRSGVIMGQGQEGKLAGKRRLERRFSFLLFQYEDFRVG